MIILYEISYKTMKPSKIDTAQSNLFMNRLSNQLIVFFRIDYLSHGFIFSPLSQEVSQRRCKPQCDKYVLFCLYT